VAEPSGGRKTYTYDSGWPRTLKLIDGQLFTYTYENRSTDSSLRRLKAVQQPSGGIQSFQYDASDRLTQIMRPDGTRNTFTWTGNRVRTFLNANSYCTTYTYGSRGELTKAENGVGCVVTLTYDSRCQIVIVCKRPAGPYGIGGRPEVGAVERAVVVQPDELVQDLSRNPCDDTPTTIITPSLGSTQIDNCFSLTQNDGHPDPVAGMNYPS
jgi:YD repeat-containing protein